MESPSGPAASESGSRRLHMREAMASRRRWSSSVSWWPRTVASSPLVTFDSQSLTVATFCTNSPSMSPMALAPRASSASVGRVV